MRIFRLSACWLFSLSIVWTFGPSSVFAAVPELDFARGVVAFSQGHLSEAEAYFQKVLNQQPHNSQALYYLGQVKVGLGKLSEAIDTFRTVIGLRPTDAAVRLDLALALVKAEHFPQALEELSPVSEQLSDRASFHYYRGFCSYRMGKMQEALEPLQKAQQLDQGFAAAAGYYLGLVHYRLGKTEQALQQFSDLTHKESGGYSALARQNLALIEQGAAARAEKRYFLYAQFGGGYDSNVTLDTTDISHARAPKLFIAVGGSFLPYRTANDTIELSGNLYRSFHFTDETEGYNLTNVALTARYRRLIASRLQLQVGYLFDLDCLDGNASLGMSNFGIFMHGHTVQTRLRINEGRSFETSIEYRFNARFFHLDRRDNFGHEFVVRQDFFLAEGTVQLSLSAGMVVEDARGREYDLWGPLVASDATWRITNAIYVQAAFGWQRQDYYRFGDVNQDAQQVDDQLAGSMRFGWDFLEHLGLMAEYQYINNLSSNEPCRYERHVGIMSVIGRM